jgi:hypothetical protein
MPLEVAMTIDELIRALAIDSNLPRKLDASAGIAAAIGTGLAVLLFFVAIGFRPDIESAIRIWRFLLKFAITLPLAVAATVATLKLGRPGAALQRLRRALMFSPLLLLIAAASELFVLPKSDWMIRLVGSNAERCMTLIPFLAICPLVSLLIALKHAAPTNPALAGATAGLAAGGIAATLYAASCFDDSPLFVVTWYPLATGIVVLAGYFWGRRFLAW